MVSFSSLEYEGFGFCLIYFLYLKFYIFVTALDDDSLTALDDDKNYILYINNLRLCCFAPLRSLRSRGGAR